MLTKQLDDLELLRERLCAAHDSFGHDPLTKHSSACDAWRDSLGPDGLWPDVAYACDHLKDWRAADHLRRLLLMARVWSEPASPRHGDTALLAAVLRGLDGWYQRAPQNPNWWWMQIGAPQQLADVLLHVVGACDASYVVRAVPAFTAHQPATRFTGQNLVWVATIQICHGVLIRDPALISQGFMFIGRETRVLPREEGIQPDMSFFQHGLLLYAGGYGQGFAADVARTIWLAHGTRYAWPAEKIALITRYLLDGCRWMVRGETFDYGAIGREITRCGHNASRLFAGARFLAALDTPQREALHALATGGDGSSRVTGNRMFWCADLMTHHRHEYAVTVRVPSLRVENADMPCCGGEGRLCHHMADGTTFFYRDGNEYRDVFPVWNWRQIPGTTVEQHDAPLDPEKVRGRGAAAFAGGVSDGVIGCSAVAFIRDTLRARKAWFLFDGGIVALGAAITSDVPVSVYTTINQCRRRGPVRCKGRELPAGTASLAPGDTVVHDGLTVALLAGGAAGEVRVERRTGAWADCGVGSDVPETQEVVTIGINHDTQPAGASYAYAVHPAGTAGEPWRSAITVLRNDAAVQAVWQAGEASGQAVFYEAGEICFPDGQTLAVDRPCLVLYQHKAGRAALTVADPQQREASLTVTLRGRVTAEVGIALPQREYAGSSLMFVVA